ncbi:MAG: tetratricopeptide repeat protein [Acidobacteria bacterium]|nr:tetratricopeptide repeat protein [Acidobacteriota bacterium]
MRTRLVDALIAASNEPGTALAPAALVIARIEYPNVDTARYVAELDRMGDDARRRIDAVLEESGEHSTKARLGALAAYLYEDRRFVGNRTHYEDPRNSCLNEVIDRRTGIPITLALVYMEVAQRVGLEVEGVNFPGHFLVRCLDRETPGHSGQIVDPFNAGALLSERECRLLLRQQVGGNVPFSRSLLAAASRRDILVRMLLNLKRIYVHMRSFPQAHEVTGLLLALNPSALSELRDRGLLAFHLNDVGGALSDLQSYLRLAGLTGVDKKTREEHAQIWEHVKTLRRRMASLN